MSAGAADNRNVPYRHVRYGWQLVLAEAERSDENVHRITGKHAASPAQAASGQLGFQHGS